MCVCVRARCFRMPGLPNRTSVPPPNVTMAYRQSGHVIQPQSNGVWNASYTTNCNTNWTSVPPASTAAQPVRQTFDVIARRRNPHYWTAAGTNNPAVSSPVGGNSPLTPTPTPSPATPSPISPAYPNRPVSVSFRVTSSIFLLNLLIHCQLHHYNFFFD